MLGNALAVRCLVFEDNLFLFVVWLEVLIFVVSFVLSLRGALGCTFTFGFWDSAIVYVVGWVLLYFLVGGCLESFLIVVGGVYIFSCWMKGKHS